MTLRVPEVWQDFDELIAASDAGAVAGAEPSPSISVLVDRLLLSLEGILAPLDTPLQGERRLGPQPISQSPRQRLILLAQRVDGLAPPARALMQRLLDEVTGQLLEIRRIGSALQDAVRDSDEARRAAEQHALTDPLTGLLNRRGFAECAGRVYAQACAAREPVLLLFVDIDRMKQINDHGGHPAGDRALQVAAEALRRSFRGEDLIVRWGGDEFAVLSVSNPMDAASAVERIGRQAALVCAEHAIAPAVTLSIGTALREAGESCSLDQLLARADHAMYRRKRAAHERLPARAV